MRKMMRKPARSMQFETGLTGTPYARVHAGFLPLFEVPIRCLVTPRT